MEDHVEESILSSIKKMLGIHEDLHDFDTEIIININTIFGVLYQLGVDAAFDYRIEGSDEVWSDLIDDNNLLYLIKTYVYLRVRILFDPPTNSFLLNSMQEQANELEWRINIQAEGGFDGNGSNGERPGSSSLRRSWHEVGCKTRC